MSNVKLAIRVRPFTEKEFKLEKEKVSVINVVDEHTVTITNLKVNVSGAGDSRARVRRYFTDYTFDSSCAPTDSKYASQEVIFATLGRQVLSSISRGQSACVLAYGQSATGKTHTMMGSSTQPGLIPRICKALADEQLTDITISFLEIYNERVHDLLAGEPNLPLNSLPRRKGNVRKDLRVREHPTKGPYVQNLRRVTVKDAESLLAIVYEGTRRRQTAATKRNSSSSRSHALIELVTPQATLHLADLAGSEKAGWEGAGGRQKEGANINKSLVALSNVISALVSGGVTRSRFVPYRDSALTWLLKDCFTGGGSTFIIATISPSASCYGESASTLRWASRARRLPDTEKPNTKSKVALQTLFDSLIAELARNYIQYKTETGELLYHENHWSLYANKKIKNNSSKETKIGNIMNLRYPRNDSQSESTPSSIASSSIEVINNTDKNAEISNEINKEIDKLFGPALERTRSGIDIEIETPLKYKQRHSRSQEILTTDIQERDVLRLSDVGVNETKAKKYIQDIKAPSQVSILHNSQRAEIIASVTERLYSKLKNASKAESFLEKKAPSDIKIMQPLNELKICSNARQRLMELSKKALRNKRKIGIPAHTQTRKTVIRVKDQAIDVQSDLQPYVNHQEYIYKFQKDVGTETVLMTPRLKEAAVGSNYSNLSFADKSTLTETKKISYKNTYSMTDIVLTNNHSTQTQVLPPPRRKKRLSNYAKFTRKSEHTKSSTDESTQNVSPIININITSAMYATDSDSHSSDEIDFYCNKNKLSASTTPDLLTNHNNVAKNNEENEINCDKTNLDNFNVLDKNISPLIDHLDDFSDEDLSLPRVKVDGTRKIGRKDYEDLIFGRNEKLYPYNIKISPFKEKNGARKIIRFEDVDSKSEGFTETRSDDDVLKERKLKRYNKNKFQRHLRNDDLDSSESNTDSDLIRKKNIPEITGDYQKKGQECFKCNKDDFSIRNKPKYFHAPCEETCDSDINKMKRNIYDFDIIEKHINTACHSLEASVNHYDNYLLSQKKKNCNSDTRTPTEYLQHLIKLRREAIKLEYQEEK